MSKIIIEVRTDLPSINPHDHLDFLLEFKPYLEFISNHFNGYLSQSNFFNFMERYFGRTESQSKTILKKLIKSNWIGQENIGNRHKILYLKRKARVCLKEKNLSDLPSPSNRTIIRSLLIEQFSIEHRTIEFRRNVCEINKGFDPKDIIVAILPSGAVQILFIDLVRKTAKQYAELIESFLSDERFHGQKIYIRFLSYTNARKKTLFKVLQETPVTTLVSLNQSRLKIGGKCYDLLYYFDNTEPLL